MRFATLASLFIAGFAWFALVSTPVEVRADEHAKSCQTCGKSSPTTCPHCAEGKDCSHCTDGKDCPHCKGGEACPHCEKGKSCAHCAHKHGHHGKWGAHKWDYKCVRPAKKPVDMTKQFKALGEQGWKLSGVDSGIWCFTKMKR
jgi:hypothetical protein